MHININISIHINITSFNTIFINITEIIIIHIIIHIITNRNINEKERMFSALRRLEADAHAEAKYLKERLELAYTTIIAHDVSQRQQTMLIHEQASYEY